MLAETKKRNAGDTAWDNDEKTEYEYSPMGWLKFEGRSQYSGSWAVVYDITQAYDKNGNRTGYDKNVAMGQTASFGRSENLTYTFDNNNRPTGISDADDSTYDCDITCDANGNITQIDEKGVSGMTVQSTLTQEFQYDWGNRMTSYKTTRYDSGAAKTKYVRRQHAYDATGRMVRSVYKNWETGQMEPGGNALEHTYAGSRPLQNYDGSSTYGAVWVHAGAAHEYGPLKSPAPDTSSQKDYNTGTKWQPNRRSFQAATAASEGDKRLLYGQGRAMTKDASGSGGTTPLYRTNYQYNYLADGKEVIRTEQLDSSGWVDDYRMTYQWNPLGWALHQDPEAAGQRRHRPEPVGRSQTRRSRHRNNSQAGRLRHRENSQAGRLRHRKNSQAGRSRHRENSQAGRLRHRENSQAGRSRHRENSQAGRSRHRENSQAGRLRHRENSQARRTRHRENSHGRGCRDGSATLACYTLMMRGRSSMFVVTAAALAALLQGCASGARPDSAQGVLPPPPAVHDVVDNAVTPGPAGVSLPSPAALEPLLPAPRAASFELVDLHKQAESYNFLLPSKRVTVALDSLTFSPQWSPGDSIEGLAYAMYSFAIPDYESDSIVSYFWKTAPPDAQEVYIALANWGKGRWDWFQGNDAARLELPSFEPYLTAEGNMVICFLMTGEDPGVLDYLRIGGPVQVKLTVDEVAGIAPCAFTLVAEAQAFEGSIAEYVWDLDGDGSIDLSTGMIPAVVPTYEAAQRYRPVVRVIDSNGEYGEAKTSFAVYDAGIFNFGISDLRDSAVSVAIGSDGRLLVAGYSDEATSEEVQIFALDPQGELLFSRTCEGSGINLDASAMGSDGFLYACGQRSETEEELILQKWSQDGTLIWTRVWGDGSFGDYFAAIDALPDGRLVCAGTRYAETYNGTGGFVLCFNGDGSLDWVRTFTEPDSDVDLLDLEVFTGPGGPEIRVCGIYERGDSDAYYAAFDNSGNLINSQIWDCLDIDAGAYSIASMPDGEAYLACDFAFFGLSVAAVTVVGGGSVQLADADNKSLYASDLRALEDGRLHLTMRLDSLSPVLGTLNTALNVGAMQQFASDSAYNIVSGTNVGDDGLVLCGSASAAPPALTGYVPNTGSADLGDWTEFSPGYITPVVNLSEREITVVDNSADFLPGDDSDRNHMLVFVKP